MAEMLRRSKRTPNYKIAIWQSKNCETIQTTQTKWKLSELVEHFKSQNVIPQCGQFKMQVVDFRKCTWIPVNEILKTEPPANDHCYASAQTRTGFETEVDIREYSNFNFEVHRPENANARFEIISGSSVLYASPRRMNETLDNGNFDDSSTDSDDDAQNVPLLASKLNSIQDRRKESTDVEMLLEILEEGLEGSTATTEQKQQRPKPPAKDSRSKPPTATECHFCMPKETSTETRLRCRRCKLQFHSHCLQNRGICQGEYCDLGQLLHQVERDDGSFGCPDWLFDLSDMKQLELLSKMPEFRRPQGNICLCCIRSLILSDSITVGQKQIFLAEMPDEISRGSFESLKSWAFLQFGNIGSCLLQCEKYDPTSQKWSKLKESTQMYLQIGQTLTKKKAKLTGSQGPLEVKFVAKTPETLTDIVSTKDRHRPIKLDDILTSGSHSGSKIRSDHTLREFQQFMEISLSQKRPLDLQIEIHDEIKDSLDNFRIIRASRRRELFSKWRDDFKIPGLNLMEASCSSFGCLTPTQFSDESWGLFCLQGVPPQISSPSIDLSCGSSAGPKQKTKAQLKQIPGTSTFDPVEQFDHLGVKWWIVVVDKGSNMHRYHEMIKATTKSKCPAFLQQRRFVTRIDAFLRWQVDFVLIKQTVGQVVLLDYGVVHSTFDEVPTIGYTKMWLTRDFFTRKVKSRNCECRVPKTAQTEIMKILTHNYGRMEENGNIDHLNLSKLVECVHGRNFLRIPAVLKNFNEEKKKSRQKRSKRSLKRNRGSDDPDEIILGDELPAGNAKRQNRGQAESSDLLPLNTANQSITVYQNLSFNQQNPSSFQFLNPFQNFATNTQFFNNWPIFSNFSGQNQSLDRSAEMWSQNLTGYFGHYPNFQTLPLPITWNQGMSPGNFLPLAMLPFYQNNQLIDPRMTLNPPALPTTATIKTVKLGQHKIKGCNWSEGQIVTFVQRQIHLPETSLVCIASEKTIFVRFESIKSFRQWRENLQFRRIDVQILASPVNSNLVAYLQSARKSFVVDSAWARIRNKHLV